MTQPQYHAARNTAAVVRQDWMGVLRLTGQDRHTWLQGMVTNEVEKLTPGQGCYAGHLNAQGKLVAQMIVLDAEDAIWLLVERAASEKLVATFDRLIIMEDAQIQEVSAEYSVLGLAGPQIGRVLTASIGEGMIPGGLYGHRAAQGFRVVRDDLGCVLVVRQELTQDVLLKISDAGATPVDAETWNILRIEAGLPQYGTDIDETTVFPELGQRGISYDKGCYIGQEVVARIKYIGHVNRRFVGFICEGPAVPVPRSAVVAQGKDVGYVTSAALSPALSRPVALGFVSRSAAEPGTPVELVGSDGRVQARVAALPLVS